MATSGRRARCWSPITIEASARHAARGMLQAQRPRTYRNERGWLARAAFAPVGLVPVMSNHPQEHFVYVYRDRAGNPAYFGQGSQASRPAEDLVNPRRQTFGAWLAEQQGQHRIEMIGPLESKEMADAIETALISACASSTVLSRTLFNADPGDARFRFLRYGIPQQFAERAARRLGRDDFDELTRRHGTLMFVRIDQLDPDTERGPGLAHSPDDAGIRARVEGLWRVGPYLKHWTAAPAQSPVLLVGVTGGPDAQVVISSSFVDRTRWAETAAGRDGLVRIPLLDQDIDALQLRGRPIAVEFRLRFERARAGHFRIFETSGFDHLPRPRGNPSEG
jgi:hypothetical protein